MKGIWKVSSVYLLQVCSIFFSLFSIFRTKVFWTVWTVPPPDFSRALRDLEQSWTLCVTLLTLVRILISFPKNIRGGTDARGMELNSKFIFLFNVPQSQTGEKRVLIFTLSGKIVVEVEKRQINSKDDPSWAYDYVHRKLPILSSTSLNQSL